LTRQVTCQLQAPHRAYTSELYGLILTKIFTFKPRRRHRVAHRAAHRWEPCEIGGIVEMLSSEDVSDDDVLGEAREGFLRVGKARGSSGRRDITAHGSHGCMRCVGEYVKGVGCASCARRCASRLPRKALY